MNDESGTAIVLAYPEVTAEAGSSWYIQPLKWLGIVNKGLLRYGHAAIILADKDTGTLEFTHFSRYGAPISKGKARTCKTDPQLCIEIQAVFNQDNHIENIHEILNHIYTMPLGTPISGVMYAAILDNISYNKTKNYIDYIVNQGAVPYGAFTSPYLSCSLYIYKAVRAALTNPWLRIRHYLLNILIASPLGNVLFIPENEKIFIVSEDGIQPYQGNRILDCMKFFLSKTPITQTPYLKKIRPSDRAQWLGSIFVGMWLEMTPEDADSGLYRITGYISDSNPAFEKLFVVQDQNFNFYEEYQFVYICDALRCHIKQHDKIYRFEPKKGDSLVT